MLSHEFVDSYFREGRMFRILSPGDPVKTAEFALEIGSETNPLSDEGERKAA